MNAIVGNKIAYVITGNAGHIIEDKTGVRLTDFCQENSSSMANIFFHHLKEECTHKHH